MSRDMASAFFLTIMNARQASVPAIGNTKNIAPQRIAVQQ